MEDKSLREQILELVGEASMCWDSTGSAIFDPAAAEKVGEKILDVIEQSTKQEAVWWRLAIAHLDMKRREKVIDTYEAAKKEFIIQIIPPNKK